MLAKKKQLLRSSWESRNIFILCPQCGSVLPTTCEKNVQGVPKTADFLIQRDRSHQLVLPVVVLLGNRGQSVPLGTVYIAVASLRSGLPGMKCGMSFGFPACQYGVIVSTDTPCWGVSYSRLISALSHVKALHDRFVRLLSVGQSCVCVVVDAVQDHLRRVAQTEGFHSLHALV